MALRAALVHPVGLALLVLSLVVAVLMIKLPQLYEWSDRAVWLAVWGVIAYVGVVAGSRLLPAAAPPPKPELRTLLRIREQIAGRLQRLRGSPTSSRRVELESVLEDALAEIDENIVPKMGEVLERYADLTQKFALYDHGSLPLPDAPYLQRLKNIHERQRRVIEACVQQAANADAALEAILLEGNEASMADRAREWADDLGILHDALRDVIQEEVPSEPALPLADLLQRPRPDEPSVETAVDPAFVSAVEEALRRLRNFGRLAECDLMRRLPHTLYEAMHARLNGQSADPSALERAHALQKVLIDGIERLKPLDRDDGVAPRSVQHHILREEYVDGHPTKWILAHYEIGESTLHRRRREAIDLLAADLLKQEERLARVSSR